MENESIILEFETLVRHAEKYIRLPNSSTAKAVERWRNRCLKWLKEYLPDSGLVEEFLLIPPPLSDRRRLSSTDVSKVQRNLTILLKSKELLPFLKDQNVLSVPLPDNARSVFVVHGHDIALKQSLARLLEHLDFKPIILHEQPDVGRTIIEKFTEHSNVAYAVVLLTADDRGGSVGESVRKQNLRARQNVILEMGYFLGKLGRTRVAAIYEEGVEIPSDYSGVLFIPYDSSGYWQLKLAKEMKAVGLKVDLNKV